MSTEQGATTAPDAAATTEAIIAGERAQAARIEDSMAAERRQGTDYGVSALPMKRKRKNNRGEQKRRDNRKSRYDADYVEKDERQNAEFAEYYRMQRIVPAAEHAELLKTLALPLPSSFRVVARGAFGAKIQGLLAGEMSMLFADVQDAKPPTVIPWVPGGSSWTVSAPRQMLRRDNCLSKFHRFLVECTDLGAIFRQEAVSMIPPLLLDAFPGCSVLDMCAAPGSKTGQILEMFGIPKGEGPQSLAQPGIVIANDAEIKRCWMLTHQLKRFSVSQLIVTNHDAQFFPKIMMFDRILCDVPCSGDGTLRKAPDIWRRWNCGMGMGLHRMQCSILYRGIELLKPGGRLVYSTCSLNPIENEAVVAAALYKFGPDVVELVDVSDRLPQLMRRPGMTDWKVRDLSVEQMPHLAEEETEEAGTAMKDDVVLAATASGGAEPENDAAGKGNSLSEGVGELPEAKGQFWNGDKVEKSPLRGWFTNYNQVRPRRRRKVYPTMFPPSKERLERGLCPLERCLRLVPHDQDTGGFFVAVFEKKATAQLTRNERKLANNALDSETGLVQNPELAAIESTAEKEAMHGNASDPPREAAELANDKEPLGPITTGDHDDNTATQKEIEQVGKEVRPINKEENGKKETEKNDGRIASRLIVDDPLIGVENRSLSALRNISDFFGLDLEECRVGLMTRGGDSETFKKVVLVSPAVRELLRISLGSSESDQLPDRVKRNRLRVVHAGVTLLERTSRRGSPCPFRIVSDGVQTLAACMGKRIGVLGAKDFAKLVKAQTIQITALSDWEGRRDIDALRSGSALCVDKENGEVGAVWKSRHALNLLMPKTERAAMMRRVSVGQDHVEIDNQPSVKGET